MRWLAIGAGLLALAALVVVVTGARLPQSHVVTKQAHLPVPPDVVWRAITEIDAFPSRRTNVQPERNGLARCPG